jgi:hypothetical protein
MESQSMDTADLKSNPVCPLIRTLWFRSIGSLPLIFFIARLIEYVQVGTPSQVLWMCHLANLFLAIGLFTANPLLIRVSVVLLVFGIPPWIVDMFVIKIITPLSVVTHLGGTILGLIVIAKVGATRWTWLVALASYVLVQTICRFVTPPELNVNISHRVYDIWKDIVSNYWIYWVISTGIIGVALWVIESALLRLFPPIAHRV